MCLCARDVLSVRLRWDDEVKKKHTRRFVFRFEVNEIWHQIGQPIEVNGICAIQSQNKQYTRYSTKKAIVCTVVCAQSLKWKLKCSNPTFTKRFSFFSIHMQHIDYKAHTIYGQLNALALSLCSVFIS